MLRIRQRLRRIQFHRWTRAIGYGTHAAATFPDGLEDTPERPAGAEPSEERRIHYPIPSGLEDAQRQLAETGEAFAAALEKAGSELDRPVETPFGTMLGSRVVLWGMIDLVHHHGQISFLQSLLGDKEMHFNPEGRNWFAPDA